MLTWKGYGFLVPIITVVMMLLVDLGLETAVGSHSYNDYIWAITLGFTLSGIACFIANHLLQSKSKERVYIDKETGQEVIVRKRHTFFFIDIKYWAFLLPIIGLALILMHG